MRIGSIIIFHLSKLWKTEFFILDVKLLIRLQGKFEIDHGSTVELPDSARTGSGAVAEYPSTSGILLHSFVIMSNFEERGTRYPGYSEFYSPCVSLQFPVNSDLNLLQLIEFAMCTLAQHHQHEYMWFRSLARPSGKAPTHRQWF